MRFKTGATKYSLNVSFITALVYFNSLKSSCFTNVLEPITESISSLSLYFLIKIDIFYIITYKREPFWTLSLHFHSI